MIRSIHKMTEKEQLLKSYEELTPEEIKKTLDFVLALKAQRTHELSELPRQTE